NLCEACEGSADFAIPCAIKTVGRGHGCRLYRSLRRCLAIADLGGRHNVAPLYIMSYHSFLFKKAAIAEWFDFAIVKSAFPHDS
uniref:hypothetical protein n=1 Tax=Pseudomonas aeruginosa TaxID=287 RepID=UPI0026EB42B6